MFGLMGNCMSWLKEKRAPRRSVTLAILGIDNAGKTVAAKVLQGEAFEDVAPSIGFNSVEFKMGKYDVTMFDLGGGKGLRTVWTKYLAEIYGIVYVIDSSAHERIEETRQVLQNLVENKQVCGKPMLVLANKQDIEDALDEIDICERLNLEELVNRNKCPCRVETCSAIKGIGKKLDRGIKQGMEWLLETVKQDYERMNERVQKDMEAQKEIQREEMKRRRELARKNKEERERKEAAERKRLGLPEEEEEEEEDIIDGDPFKQLNKEELERKEQKLKEKKRRRKELEEKARQREEEERNQHRNEDDDDIEVNQNNTNNVKKSPRLIHNDIESSEKPSLNAMFGAHKDDNDEDEQHEISPRGQRMLEPLDGGAGEEKKTKKKKKRLKKNNKTAPLDTGDDDDLPKLTPNPLPALNGWGTPPGQRSLMDRPASRSPRLQPIAEPNGKSFGHKWGIAEDLPELPPIGGRKLRPNIESDEEIVT